MKFIVALIFYLSQILAADYNVAFNSTYATTVSNSSLVPIETISVNVTHCLKNYMKEAYSSLYPGIERDCLNYHCKFKDENRTIYVISCENPELHNDTILCYTHKNMEMNNSFPTCCSRSKCVMLVKPGHKIIYLNDQPNDDFKIEPSDNNLKNIIISAEGREVEESKTVKKRETIFFVDKENIAGSHSQQNIRVPRDKKIKKSKKRKDDEDDDIAEDEEEEEEEEKEKQVSKSKSKSKKSKKDKKKKVQQRITKSKEQDDESDEEEQEKPKSTTNQKKSKKHKKKKEKDEQKNKKDDEDNEDNEDNDEKSKKDKKAKKQSSKEEKSKKSKKEKNAKKTNKDKNKEEKSDIQEEDENDSKKEKDDKAKQKKEKKLKKRAKKDRKRQEPYTGDEDDLDAIGEPRLGGHYADPVTNVDTLVDTMFQWLIWPFQTFIDSDFEIMAVHWHDLQNITFQNDWDNGQY